MSGSYFGHRRNRRTTKAFSFRGLLHFGIVVAAPLSLLPLAFWFSRKASRL